MIVMASSHYVLFTLMYTLEAFMHLNFIKIKNSFTLLILLFSSLTFAEYDEFEYGRYRLTIDTRPSSPYKPLKNYDSSLHTSKHGNVPVARHHIIPLQTLKNFYNKVIHNPEDLELLHAFFGTFSNHIQQYASHPDISLHHEDVDGVQRLVHAIINREIMAGGNERPLGWDTFEQLYAWLPGNLFIGPKDRSDDPADDPVSDFEANSNIIIGDKNYQLMVSLNDNLNRYIHTDDRHILHRINEQLSKLAQRTHPYTLNPENWAYIHGQYQLKTYSENDILW